MQYIFYITYLNATTKIITTKIILKVWLVFAVHFNLRVRAARHLPPLFFFPSRELQNGGHAVMRLAMGV